MSFDFDALLDVAIRSSEGAREVVSCEKKEGGFNRVFIIHLDNRATVVARLPTPLAGPRSLVLSSEVATLRYVREKTTVPVPKVLAWSGEPQTSAVGAEYMIMDAVPGGMLRDIWGTMNVVQRIGCIGELCKIMIQLCRLEFSAFGSLYLDTPDRPAQTLPLDDEYCIGPHCVRQRWNCDLGKPDPPSVAGELQGPYLTTAAKSAIAREGSRDNSVDDHLRLLDLNRNILAAVTKLDAVKDAFTPVLLHPDFHTRNIFVASDDPTHITGIIDWQSAAVEPAFVHAVDTPDFAEELPFDETLDASREFKGAEEYAARCSQAWRTLNTLFPKLNKAVALDTDLCEYLAGPSSGYLAGFLPLRSLLTDMSLKWKDFGLPGDSLYQPSQEDAATLRAELEDLQTTRRLRMILSRLLGCDIDGWVPLSRWDEVVPIYKETCEKFVESCVTNREEWESEDDAIKKAQRLWPHDLR